MSVSSSYNTKSSWQDTEAKEDWAKILNEKDKVLSGFLSIGEKEGWCHEGGPSEIGIRFNRYMLRKFWSEKAGSLSEYSDIFKRTLSCFSPSEQKKEKENNNSRVFIDGTVDICYKHAITYMVGNVCKEFRANGPFFEVKVDSAKNSLENERFPFHVSILHNAQIANDRWKKLRSLSSIPVTVAEKFLYPKTLDTPSQFITYYQKMKGRLPASNVMKFLNGLNFLTLKKMKVQSAQNCWIKQPKRAVLASLFIEILSQREEFTYSQAWKTAKKLYSKWKEFVRNELNDLCDQGGISTDLYSLVKDKIRKMEAKKLNSDLDC